MTRHTRAAAGLVALAACGGGGAGDGGGARGGVKVLDPEPHGAPTALVRGIECLGRSRSVAPEGSSVTLGGYVRTFADPEAGAAVPAAKVEAFTATGASIGTGFADVRDGRVALSVPALDRGFDGEVVVSADGFLPFHLRSNLPYARPDVNGWVWLATEAEVVAVGEGMEMPLDPSAGVVVGAVHDCDAFGAENVVVVVGGGAGSHAHYADDFTPDTARTFTGPSGRFVAMMVEGPEVAVEAYGRIEAGGPLVLLAAGTVKVVPNAISAIDLRPRED